MSTMPSFVSSPKINGFVTLAAQSAIQESGANAGFLGAFRAVFFGMVELNKAASFAALYDQCFTDIKLSVVETIKAEKANGNKAPSQVSVLSFLTEKGTDRKFKGVIKSAFDLLKANKITSEEAVKLGKNKIEELAAAMRADAKAEKATIEKTDTDTAEHSDTGNNGETGIAGTGYNPALLALLTDLAVRMENNTDFDPAYLAVIGRLSHAYQALATEAKSVPVLPVDTEAATY